MNNNATKTIIFPELTANLLLDGCTLVDNIFADLWNQMGITAKMKRMGFTKRSGTAPNQLVYCLMLWVWLKVDSVAMFALESLRTFTGAQKDALYAAMNNEDWNWRRLQLSLSLQTVKTLKAAEETSAFVLDDSIKVRHGKKMPGVSSHFDHTTGRHVMGQQVLTLGLSCAEGFVPIDNELFISQTNAQGLNQAFNDGRSVVARRYAVAQKQTKPQMARDMIRRAQRTGINAKYLLADAWFGTKAMIAMAEDQGLVPILRMKKNTMRYRFQESKAGVSTYRDLDANGLYHVNVRGRWEKIEGKAYQARTMAVELNLNGVGEKERWVPIRLLFVRGVATEKSRRVSMIGHYS